MLIFLILTDCIVASARSFPSIQHVELPLVSDTNSNMGVYAGFMVGNDGIRIFLELLFFLMIFYINYSDVFVFDHHNSAPLFSM